MSTHIINLFGGSGIGKSTTAAGLFYEMKMKGQHCELVREWIKGWAWEGIKPSAINQPFIFGNQSYEESKLINKVDWIITDGPVLLTPIYEIFYTGKSIILDSVLKYMKELEENDVVYHNFVLDRQKTFDVRGRYETEETAKLVDETVLYHLNDLGVDYKYITCTEDKRVPTIMEYLGV